MQRCVSSSCDSDPQSQGEFLTSLPPTPSSMDQLESCFSDPEFRCESRCESEVLLDETASELEAATSDPNLERVDSFITAKPNMQTLVKPARSVSAQIRSPRLPFKSLDATKSSVFILDPSLSRSEEHLIKSKSMSAAVNKRHRFSSDDILDEKRPPLPPRTHYGAAGQDLHKIISKPLPPIPCDEEEYVPNFSKRKLSSSMDCLVAVPPLQEEASPYIAPVELHAQMKREGQSLMSEPSSSHVSDRPPLPAIPVEPPARHNVSIVRSFTQYIPGKKYGHKRSRSSNCDFLKSLPKEEKPYNSLKGTRSSLNPCATLGPSNFKSYSMRANSGSPCELDLESSLKKKNSFRFKGSKQSLVPDETDQNSFGTYTRMSPAPSLEKSPLCQPQEPLRDQNGLVDNSSQIDLTKCASAVPPRRGERRKARRWETKKEHKSKSNSGNRLYWQQRQMVEGPRYVSQPRVQNGSLCINIQRHSTDSNSDSKRSSCDSNIYEHVDEDVLEDLRRSHTDGQRSSAETDPVYKSTPQPGVFPHPPTAQEWHYFMYMWRLFLQWMTEHAPPEVYSVPNNIPANFGNTSPIAENQVFIEAIEDYRKQSITSYTSIDCEWIKKIAKNQTSTAIDGGASGNGTSSFQGYSDGTEGNTVVSKHSSLRSQNSHVTLNGNGKSASSVDSGICHSHTDDSNSNGDS